MAEAATDAGTRFKHFKEKFPIFGEITTSLVGAFANEVIWNQIKDVGQKFIRREMPELNRHLFDEGLHSIIMESLSDVEKKKIETWLCKKSDRQRLDFMQQLVEMATPESPFDLKTPEGRQFWLEERVKAFAACVSYLKYLAALDDDKRRDHSAISRSFMKAKDEDYLKPLEFMKKMRELVSQINASEGTNLLRESNACLEADIARKRAAAQQPMRIRDKFRFFSLTGGPLYPNLATATATISQPTMPDLPLRPAPAPSIPERVVTFTIRSRKLRRFSAATKRWARTHRADLQRLALAILAISAMLILGFTFYYFAR